MACLKDFEFADPKNREMFGRCVEEVKADRERVEKTLPKVLRVSDDTAGIKDSGEKEAFSTGSVRDKQAGKGAFHLVPTWVVWLVSRVYEGGAVKYAPRNWEKGQPLSQYIKSAENHLAKLKAGFRDEPHASQVIWNMFGYIFTAVLIKLGRRPASLSDMPDQFNCVPGVLAEPLSDVEYESLNTFFQGAEKIVIPERGRHLTLDEDEAKGCQGQVPIGGTGFVNR